MTQTLQDFPTIYAGCCDVEPELVTLIRKRLIGDFKEFTLSVRFVTGGQIPVQVENDCFDERGNIHKNFTALLVQADGQVDGSAVAEYEVSL